MFLVAAMGATSAAPAEALSIYVPTYTLTRKDCTMTIGAHYDPGRGAAMAGLRVPCTGTHVSSQATLWLYRRPYQGSRWTGPWQAVRKSTFTATYSYGFGPRELFTQPYCGGGTAMWYSHADVTITGVGSFWLQNDTAPYSPPAC